MTPRINCKQLYKPSCGDTFVRGSLLIWPCPCVRHTISCRYIIGRFIKHVSLIFHFYPAHDRAPSNFHSIMVGGLPFIHCTALTVWQSRRFIEVQIANSLRILFSESHVHSANAVYFSIIVSCTCRMSYVDISEMLTTHQSINDTLIQNCIKWLPIVTVYSHRKWRNFDVVAVSKKLMMMMMMMYNDLMCT